MARAILILLVISILYMDLAKCYVYQKRATGESRIVDALSKIEASLDALTKGLHLSAGDCSDVASQGPYASGLYTITPWDDSRYEGSFTVYCDMETLGGGWTVVQKRFDGSVDFYRGWDEYRNGFGNIDGGEYWLGLSQLNKLTNTGLSWELRIELEDFDNNTAFAHYDNFRIGDESTSFQLTVGGYYGTAGDSLTQRHAGMPFTTKDRDNDSHPGNLAVSYQGAWWYGSGQHSNLNGLYTGSAAANSKGINWYYWKKTYQSLKSCEMKIRPVQ